MSPWCTLSDVEQQLGPATQHDATRLLEQEPGCMQCIVAYASLKDALSGAISSDECRNDIAIHEPLP